MISWLPRIGDIREKSRKKGYVLPWTIQESVLSSIRAEVGVVW